MVNERLQQALTNVQKAAQADKVGAGQAHVDLLDAVRKLNLAAESPAETLMRMRFEVCKSSDCKISSQWAKYDPLSDHYEESLYKALLSALHWRLVC